LKSGEHIETVSKSLKVDIKPWCSLTKLLSGSSKPKKWRFYRPVLHGKFFLTQGKIFLTPGIFFKTHENFFLKTDEEGRKKFFCPGKKEKISLKVEKNFFYTIKYY